MLDNVKLTTNIEYRFPISKIVEGALFTDAGNIWSLKNTGIGDEFKFNKFYKQLGIGSGFGFRFNIAYVTLRLDPLIRYTIPTCLKETVGILKE